MSRRVATITLNPAYDTVGFTPEIERGEVNSVRTTGLHAAGKGINVAKVLKDLGIDVTVGGFLGKDNRDGFQQLFSELGIANRFRVVQGRTRINVKLTEKDGEVTDFNFSGFEVTPADWERFVNDSLSWLGQFDMVLRQRQPAVRRESGSLYRLDDAPAQPVPVHYFSIAAAKRWLQG